MKLKLIINSIKLAFLASPFYFIFLIFVSVASGLSYGFVTQRTAIFFSTLENIKSTENFQFFYFNLTFFITALCLNFFLNGFINYLIEIDAKKISTITNIKLHKKINSFPVSFFESAENLEKISAAREGAFINGYIAMIVVTFFSSTIPSIISMSYFLFKINFTLGFSCIGIIIPNLIIFKKQWKNFEEADAGLLEAKRKRNYTEEMLTSKIFFKETRTLNIEPFLMEKYERHAIEYEDRSIFVKIQNLKLGLKSNIINFIFYILIFSFSLYLVLNGKISISGFGTFFTSIGTMIFLIEQIFDNDFSVVRDSLPELLTMFYIFDLQVEKKEKYKLYAAPEVTIENLSFKYPSCKKYALENINLKIKKNQVLAIVGENGSGKTTLAKLLLGLYEPTHGVITVDGCNTKITQCFQNTSAVNQNFCTYNATIAENIQIANFEKNEAEFEKFFLCNVKNIFPKKDIMLGREFGGIDLSKGQSQRLAILRGQYKDAFYIALDEPTSALDPETEAAVIAELQKTTKNKTAAIITHRLTLAKKADIILVLKNGKQIEFGNFNELMEKKGFFYKMFSAQADWYK